MRFRRIILIVFVLALCFVLLSPTASAGSSLKNETIYAALNSDGSVSRIYVVNQLTGDYTDYGNYSAIKNLSTSTTPEVNGDRITFPDEHVEGGLYYQGTTTGELPINIEINYKLEGISIDAKQLAGKTGRLSFSVKVSPNMKCDESVRDGLMAQITAKLDIQHAGSILAPGSTIITVGKSVTVSSVVLPGQTGGMEVEADIQDFYMDQITVTLLKGTMATGDIDEKLGEYDEGFDDMITSMNDMVDGTTELKEGMFSLVDGMGDISGGLGKLSEGGDELLGGMSEYGANLNDYISGIQNIIQPSADFQAGLAALSDNGTAVAQGISDLSDGLSALSSASGELKALAESLAASTDPQVAALAAGTLQTLAALEQTSGGMASASDGMDSYALGVGQMSDGYALLHNGFTGLANGGGQLNSAYDDILSGMSEYNEGVSRSAAGTRKIYRLIRGLPDEIQALIDGQIEFKDGIITAKNEMSETTSLFAADIDPPVSFASPYKNHPDSVQYILTAPVIEEKQPDSVTKIDETVNEDFLTRLAALFN